MEVGIIGLGKMGLNLALNLMDHQHQVSGYDLSEEMRNKAKEEGLKTYDSVEELIQNQSKRKAVWVMVPSGKATDSVLLELYPLLSEGDVVLEGGNSNYHDTIRRSLKFKEKGIYYLDVGTSGGISGARESACLMIGGERGIFKEYEPLFKDLAINNGYLYTGASGSGHFLKMVHNGIEYGMMQAIGEGFQLVEQSDYDYDLKEVARVWNHGSVIRGWLMELAQEAFSESPHLEEYQGIIAASGEAKWTVETALQMEVAVPVIALSLMMRNLSQEEDSFSAKVVAALRNKFGGHSYVKK